MTHRTNSKVVLPRTIGVGGNSTLPVFGEPSIPVFGAPSVPMPTESGSTTILTQTVSGSAAPASLETKFKNFAQLVGARTGTILNITTNRTEVMGQVAAVLTLQQDRVFQFAFDFPNTVEAALLGMLKLNDLRILVDTPYGRFHISLYIEPEQPSVEPPMSPNSYSPYYQPRGKKATPAKFFHKVRFDVSQAQLEWLATQGLDDLTKWQFAQPILSTKTLGSNLADHLKRFFDETVALTIKNQTGVASYRFKTNEQRIQGLVTTYNYNNDQSTFKI